MTKSPTGPESTPPPRTSQRIEQHFFPEVGAGGSTRLDGTWQFYSRVSSLIDPSMTVLDLGAGRGAALEAASGTWKAPIVILQGRVKKLIGIDVDDAVLSNRFLDEAHVYDGGKLPLADGSIDMIVSDYTLEHIDDPAVFSAEIGRVLRPGGWLCGRTPNFFSLLTLAASIAPNRSHVSLLKRIQPDRKEFDVFPTRYRLNTVRQLGKFFPALAWENYSYTYSPEPGYHFNNKAIFRMLLLYQYIKAPLLGGEVLMVFLRKKNQ